VTKAIYFLIFILASTSLAAQPRTVANFNKGWKFYLGDTSASIVSFNDAGWRNLDLPHDWSIEGSFSKDHPSTPNQGALPTGIGWYRKSFIVPVQSKDKKVYIEFDGVYRNSEVWINGQHLGKRPNGYISFRYDLTPHLKFGAKHIIAVKVDNSLQPSSRWYTGSGIYRKVQLITTNKIAVDHWGTYVTTSGVSSKTATVNVTTSIKNFSKVQGKVTIVTTISNQQSKVVTSKTSSLRLTGDSSSFTEQLIVSNPQLWSVTSPTQYSIITTIKQGATVLDEYKTDFGIRSFYFDAAKGFFLNNKPLKILGVCQHHDLGALGAAVNKRAIERQLEILKAMGVNAIRTAHNPPATEFLDLCDRMGFLVLDEAFDMWKKKKNKYDYNVEFNEWHKQDLADMIRRDRNHPSIFMWSIGNEIREQFDSSGTRIAKELADIVKMYDSTRSVTSALTENNPGKNYIYQSQALDVLGFNYKLVDYLELPKRFPGQKFLATETSSALATRGYYDMPSDSNMLWPESSKTPYAKGNPALTVSAYDHVYAYWGSSHEAGWNAVKKYDFMSGIFVWSGFDFIGEPVPYAWPARSSYYGVIDLAGFPKDAYYMYQSEWTKKPMLHLFPHWNWEPGKMVDVWAYYNNADEVELFLNGKSLGIKKKKGDTLHVMWRLKYEPGTLKAVSRLNGKTVLTREIKTAGAPNKIELVADRKVINADGEDLSFITVRVLDDKGVLVPNADNLINFTVKGEGVIAGVDNGLQTSMEPFKANYRKAFNGLCLAIVQSKHKKGNIVVEANAEGLQKASITIQAK
jgi:beta-galactosidase